MLELIDFFKQFEQLFVTLALSLARMFAFISTAQILSSGTISRLPRNAVVIALCAPVVPVNYVSMLTVEYTAASFALTFFKEYAIGLVIGYAVGWLFWAVQASGALIDNQRGAAIAASIDPLQGHETSPLGNLFSQAFTTYLFTTGGMLVIINIVYTSFWVWPVTKMVPLVHERFPELMLEILDTFMDIMFVIAAPVVGIMFLAEFSLALVSRFAPQIQVFILAMPIKSGIAVFILVLYFSTLFPYAASQSEQFSIFIDEIYNLLRAGERVVPLLPEGSGLDTP